MNRSALRDMDFALFLAAAGLVAVSAIAMASAASTINPGLAVRHWTWSGLGLLACLFATRSNYLRWVDASLILYLLSMVTLICVHLVGPARLGATRWLSLGGFSLQPSELAKLSTVIFLARYLSGEPNPLPLRTLFISAAIMALPAGLIFIQPDLGSASIMVAIWLGMVIVAGASRRTLAGLLSAVCVLTPLAWHVLKDYQRDRLLVFIDPQSDPLGAGYTIIQSVIAIGSGRFFGRGWFSGTQNQLSFLPERHSDFLFSVIGEEWGLAGCCLVILLFGLMLARVVRVGVRSTEPTGRLIAAGFFAWVGYQAFVNMGMVMGALPVVGVPLPLISYGGSSMVMVLTGVGIVQSIGVRNR